MNEFLYDNFLCQYVNVLDPIIWDSVTESKNATIFSHPLSFSNSLEENVTILEKYQIKDILPSSYKYATLHNTSHCNCIQKEKLQPKIKFISEILSTEKMNHR